MKSSFLLLAFSAGLAAQGLEGDVVDAVTGAPVEGAYVSSYMNSGPIISRTDAAGHFHFVETPLSSLQVVRTGYLRAGGSGPPQSSAGLSTVRIALTPEAVISGKVQDEDGFPVERAQVWAMHYRLVNGERQLQPVGTLQQSDDLGQFRLNGLPAGRYHIRVAPGDLVNWDKRYVPLFFPGGLQPGDTDLFEAQAGQELSGVELRLTKYDGVSVTGRVVNADGAAALGNRFVSLHQSGGLGFHGTGWLQGDGNFTIRHVPPGDYVLRMQSGNYPPKAGDFMAQQQVQVGGSDVRGIVLTRHEVQAVDLPGTIVIEGGGKLAPMRIGVRGGMGSGVTTRSDEDGSFVVKGLLPGHYSIQVRPDLKIVNGEVDPASFRYVPAVSARLGEKEVLRAGFDLDGPPAGPLRITLSSRSFRASGVLLDAAGRPVAGAMVMFMSTSRPITQTWPSRTDSKGAFGVSLRAAGEFRVFVAPDQSGTDLLSDPDYIEAHRQDYPPIRLVDGPNPPLTLRMPAK